MAEEQGQERSEQATAKRREDFRKKGQVAQSREVNTALLLSASILLWFIYAEGFWHQLAWLVRHFFELAGTFDLTNENTVEMLLFIALRCGLLLFPLLLMVLVVGFFASFIQIGWLLTGKPLLPDFSKLDPIKGAARFVSKRSLVELLKSLIKVVLVGAVAYQTVFNAFDGALRLVDMEVLATLQYVGQVSLSVLLKSCGVMLLLALVDFLFVRWEMEEKMKMTKQEQKEEFKESEGDPHIKAKVRSLQQQMARRRMMAEVPKADVVITNPTHLSIALRYEEKKMDAPMVVAKGADELALRIREIAREHRVPLVENVAVARALYQVEVGHVVPEQMFQAVAEILAYVYSLKRRPAGPR
ncbi:flagellar biosynthesis protein FlhB [Desulfuromonas thiophila]|jgi:flagellar biosynthetic protein FlhB|uniref:flagellar biosynthesis protein FlhB n=1 Tax=Desulfuromonas thiophila TaxID=57664 RepID=UPI0024A997CE|nr:flagellar biosynthesis protein FlhB [Desulfuromonas thiophila]